VTALAFERAFRRRRSFDRHRGDERAWLFGIARNAALDELRRRGRHATLAFDPVDHDRALDEADDSAALRIPAGRLQTTLAELSKLPHAHLLSRSDASADVNQTFTSLRRNLANAQAERRGLLRALAAAATADQALRLKDQLDTVGRTIAGLERAQRGLDRRIAYSQVALTVVADDPGAGGASFTPRRALHDAVRVLAVTAGVLVIAAAALVPFAVLLALALPLARTLRRRRREQALDAV
jgi:DNA-directed RNA polymerase specialized sigma24 family protein